MRFSSAFSVMFASLLRRATSWTPPPTVASAWTSPMSGPLQTRFMSVLKSPSVQRWLGQKAIEQPTMWRPHKNWEGKWRGPELGRRKQALQAKEAIRLGDIKLEPTVMVPPPKFKGHKRVQRAENRRAIVAQKMAEMPKLIAEYRAERLAKRAKLRAMNRWK